MRRFGLTFAVLAALGASALGAGIAAAPVLAASTTASSSSGSAGASTSALTAKQRAAKRKALKKCAAKNIRPARKRCRARVKKRFAPKPVKPVQAEPAAVIDVGDDYFYPAAVNIDRGDSILWVWNGLNHDPHDLTLTSYPSGVERSDFETGYSPSVEYSFRRTFTTPGTYNFVCSLHFKMKIDVVVK